MAFPEKITNREYKVVGLFCLVLGTILLAISATTFVPELDAQRRPLLVFSAATVSSGAISLLTPPIRFLLILGPLSLVAFIVTGLAYDGELVGNFWIVVLVASLLRYVGASLFGKPVHTSVHQGDTTEPEPSNNCARLDWLYICAGTFLLGSLAYLIQFDSSIENKRQVAVAAFEKHGATIQKNDRQVVIGINLFNRDITDNDLKTLHFFPELETLNLEMTKITDEGLEHLQSATRLTTLRLDSTDITNDGLRHLKSLVNLRSLNLGDTAITDAGLLHLKGLKGLKVLHLDNLPITNPGIIHLQGLTNLELLNLRATQITDDNLQYLKGLTKLKELRLSSRHLTNAGIAALRSELPNCQIHHHP